MASKFLSINEIDIIKGFVVAILSASLTSLYNLLVAGTTVEKAQLIACWVAGITAWLGYLIKNVFKNSEWDYLKVEKKL